MKKSFAIVLLLFANVSFAVSQISDSLAVIEGHVYSEEEEPLAFSHVYLVGTSYGTVTNMDGGFVLKFKKSPSNLEGKVRISSIGYESIEIDVNNLAHNGYYTLKRSTVLLTEVVVSDSMAHGNIDSARFFLDMAIGNIKVNYTKKRHQMEAFFREVSIRDTTYTRLVECALLIDDPGYRRSAVSSEQYSTDYNIQVFGMRKSDDHITNSVMASLYNTVFGKTNSIYSTLNNNYVKFIGVIENNHIFSKKSLDNYMVTIEEYSKYEGNDLVLLKLVPKGANGKQAFITEIRLAINLQDYAFLKIEYNVLANSKLEKVQKGAIKGQYIYQSVVTYSKRNNRYFPHYIWSRRYQANTDAVLRDGSVQYSEEELLVNEIRLKGEYKKIKNKYMVEEDTDLYDIDCKYDKDFWDSYQSTELLPLSGEVLSDLERKRSIQEQFETNQ